jgi:hypothetical protein
MLKKKYFQKKNIFKKKIFSKKKLLFVLVIDLFD